MITDILSEKQVYLNLLLFSHLLWLKYYVTLLLLQSNSKWVLKSFSPQIKLKGNTDVCVFGLLYTDAPINSKVMADIHPKNPLYLFF